METQNKQTNESIVAINIEVILTADKKPNGFKVLYSNGMSIDYALSYMDRTQEDFQ